jgi:hypothetical protein
VEKNITLEIATPTPQIRNNTVHRVTSQNNTYTEESPKPTPLSFIANIQKIADLKSIKLPIITVQPENKGNLQSIISSTSEQKQESKEPRISNVFIAKRVGQPLSQTTKPLNSPLPSKLFTQKKEMPDNLPSAPIKVPVTSERINESFLKSTKRSFVIASGSRSWKLRRITFNTASIAKQSSLCSLDLVIHCVASCYMRKISGLDYFATLVISGLLRYLAMTKLRFVLFGADSIMRKLPLHKAFWQKYLLTNKHTYKIM